MPFLTRNHIVSRKRLMTILCISYSLHIWSCSKYASNAFRGLLKLTSYWATQVFILNIDKFGKHNFMNDKVSSLMIFLDTWRDKTTYSSNQNSSFQLKILSHISLMFCCILLQHSLIVIIKTKTLWIIKQSKSIRDIKKIICLTKSL